jgi:ubiquinol-cytochrome c reductase cytochrome b subunit
VSAQSVDTFAAGAEKDTWTGRIRKRGLEELPPDRLLPDRQPAYVASWIYVFGALSIGAFAVVLLSGGVLAVEGPSWWHKSNAGLFVNSLHMWSTEFFFMFMVVHLWAKFFMAAWRGKRKATWISGVLAFALSIGTAFTGYLSQQNFDSEWIGTQAKDGINSTGAGAFWNVLNFGQMLMWHIVLLPLVVAALIGVHVLLVRRRGVVPPFAPTDGQLARAGLSLTGAVAAPPAESGAAAQLPAELSTQIPASTSTQIPSGLSDQELAALIEVPSQQPPAQEPVVQEPAAHEPPPPTVPGSPDAATSHEPAAEGPAGQDSMWQLPKDES